MSFKIKEEGQYKFIEQGEGHTVVLLHGLFGALSNWGGVLDYFSRARRVAIPLLPIYTGTPACKSVEELAQFVEGFMDARGYGRVSIVGNSLGGHVALLLALR